MSTNSSEQQDRSAESSHGSTARDVTRPMDPSELGRNARSDTETSVPSEEVDRESTALRHVEAANQMLEASLEADNGGSATNSGTDEVASSTDPAIEEYVASLIARSRDAAPARGDSRAVETAPINRRPAEPPQPVQSTTASEPNGEAPPASDTDRDSSWTPVAPPEHRDAISELRELSNMNARTSFSVHRARQLVYEMHHRLAAAFMTLAISITLAALTPHASSWVFCAAAIALIVSVYWTFRYFQLGRQLRALCFSPRVSAAPGVPSTEPAES